MAHFEVDEYGMRYFIDDNGNETPAPEVNAAEALVISTRNQLNEYGRGIRSFFGEDVSAEQAEADRLLAPLERANPVASFAGEMLPSLLTAPIGVGGRLANLGVQGALGAAEGFLDYSNEATGSQRALAGGLAGMGGDIVGNYVGRIMKGARGLADDMRISMLERAGVKARPKAANKFAAAYEDRGGRTLAYQRFEPGSEAADQAKSNLKGALTMNNRPAIVDEVFTHNNNLHRGAAVTAVGLDPANYGNLGPEFIDDALNRFQRGFFEIEEIARAGKPLKLSSKLTKRLKNNPEIKAWRGEEGAFKGIMDTDDARGVLQPGEYIDARNALLDHIDTLYNRGKNNRAIKAESLLNELDSQMSRNLPENFRDDFARLREQYRVYRVLEKPNVINNEGQINVNTLDKALKSQTSGFGRTATRAGDTTNDETKELIDLMRDANRPEFKAFASSGTAENLQLGQEIDAATDALEGLLRGDPVPSLGFIGRRVTPLAIGASEAGGGMMYQGFKGASPGGARTGSYLGRSALDEELYPFVGAYDDRQN